MDEKEVSEMQEEMVASLAERADESTLCQKHPQ